MKLLWRLIEEIHKNLNTKNALAKEKNKVGRPKKEKYKNKPNKNRHSYKKQTK